ncbi:MAG: glucoamylase family protein, partial [Planctomycetota bacterium]
PWGYGAHSPTNDNGTIAPTAALSAMPYVPDESIATLKHLYYTYGWDLWGPFGFFDAFNLTEDWVAPGYVAIDQGPIVIMIENYRTQLCWDLFMANAEIRPMLDAIGWTYP